MSRHAISAQEWILHSLMQQRSSRGPGPYGIGNSPANGSAQPRPIGQFIAHCLGIKRLNLENTRTRTVGQKPSGRLQSKPTALRLGRFDHA